jgi:hypothetical protein
MKVVPFVPGKAIKRKLSAVNEYEEVKNELRAVLSNAGNIIKIIEDESKDHDRRLAFLQTTLEEASRGADYTTCKSIEDISRVYAKSLVNRLYD